MATLSGRDDNFSSLMGTAETRLKGVAGATGHSMHAVQEFGVALGAVAAGVLISSVKQAANYQTLTTALVTGAGESKAALAAVSQGVLNMAGQVGVAAPLLAQGLYQIESAGYHGAAGLQVLRAAAMGSKADMASQATVANALTTVLTDYKLSASNAAGVTGQMIAAVSAGKMRLEDFASSLSKVLPIAAALHIPFQQIAAAEAVMTAQGVPAAKAATAIQAALVQLINPSGPATKGMQGLGISIKNLQNDLASGNFTGAMGMIKTAMDRATASGMSQSAMLKDTDGHVRWSAWRRARAESPTASGYL